MGEAMNDQDGFEFEGVFYAWHVSDMGKDLRLIDHFTGMPVSDFFEAVRDSFDGGRGPVLLALIATSIRHARPDWSVERVARLVDGLSLSDVVFLDAGNEEGDGAPPPSAGDEPASRPESSPTSSPSVGVSPGSEMFESLSGSPV